MHIVLVHNSRIPPLHYGGTERVVDLLIRGLAELGHQVTLLAASGSHSSFAECRVIDASTPEAWQKQIPASADVVHLHAPVAPDFRLPNHPLLITIHGNGKPGEVFHPNSVFVSSNHAKRHRSSHFVYNGVNPQDYEIASKTPKTAVFLAKASWRVKNLPGAKETAKKAGFELMILGGKRWPWKIFSGLISRPRVHYCGMVGDSEKKEILKTSLALLFPVRWDEPFGLAVIESMASGCSVFGTPYGSLPELVTAKTGFLGTSPTTLAHSMMHFDYQPELCRKRVVENFTHLHMAKNYVKYYERILTQELLCPVDSLPRGPQPKEIYPWHRDEA